MSKNLTITKKRKRKEVNNDILNSEVHLFATEGLTVVQLEYMYKSYRLNRMLRWSLKVGSMITASIPALSFLFKLLEVLA